jgi:hypothetical protein
MTFFFFFFFEFLCGPCGLSFALRIIEALPRVRLTSNVRLSGELVLLHTSRLLPYRKMVPFFRVISFLPNPVQALARFILLF